MLSVKLMFPFFRRCGLLFGSQQNSEEFPAYPCEGGFLMNCSVIEMGRVSSLLNDGSTFTVCVLTASGDNWRKYALICFFKNQHAYWEIIKKILCLWWLLSIFRQKEASLFMSILKAAHPIGFHICEKFMDEVWGRRIHVFRRDSVLAVRKEALLIQSGCG